MNKAIRENISLDINTMFRDYVSKKHCLWYKTHLMEAYIHGKRNFTDIQKAYDYFVSLDLTELHKVQTNKYNNYREEPMTNMELFKFYIEHIKYADKELGEKYMKFYNEKVEQ